MFVCLCIFFVIFFLLLLLHSELDLVQVKKHKGWSDFNKCVSDLAYTDLSKLKNNNEFIAFFLNVYTCLLFHAYVLFGIPPGLWSRSKLCNQASYTVGGIELSLFDIEHGILRQNRKAPSCLFSRFGDRDPRKIYKILESDPRIIFALMGSLQPNSPIRVYRSVTLDTQLDSVVIDLLNDESFLSINLLENTLYLPQELRLYQNDIAPTEAETITWCLQYLAPSAVNSLKALLVCKIILSYNNTYIILKHIILQ